MAVTRERGWEATAARTQARLERYAEAVALVEAGEAKPNVARAVELLRRGYNGIEIADTMGLSRTQVYQLLSDPTDAKNKARKARQNGTCENCGAVTSYGKAGERPARFCHRCQGEAYRKWTHERIIEAIQLWAKNHGGPPSATDWNTAVTKHPDAHDHDLYPPTNTVRERFRTWNIAIKAAGFEPRWNFGSAGPGTLSDEEKQRTLEMDAAGFNHREIAEELGVTSNAISQRLRRLRGDLVSAPLRAVTVIDRELGKYDARIKKNEEELEILRTEREKLAAAKAALNGGAAKSA